MFAIGHASERDVFLGFAEAVFLLEFPLLTGPFTEDAGGVGLDVVDAFEVAIGRAEEVFRGPVAQGGERAGLAGGGERPCAIANFAQHQHHVLDGFEFAFVPECEVFGIFLLGEAEAFVEGQGDAGFGLARILAEPLGVLAGHGFHLGDVFVDFGRWQHHADLSARRHPGFKQSDENLGCFRRMAE